LPQADFDEQPEKKKHKHENEHDEQSEKRWWKQWWEQQHEKEHEIEQRDGNEHEQEHKNEHEIEPDDGKRLLVPLGDHPIKNEWVGWAPLARGPLLKRSESLPLW
jgi:hypothetical protein